MNITIKKKLEEDRPHAFDKKVLQREMAKGEPMVKWFYKEDPAPIEDLDLETLRTDMTKGGEDITSTPMEEFKKLIRVGKHMIQVTVYKKEGEDIQRPGILFIHGGGFFGGAVEAKGNQCRYLAEQSDAVVVSPEYRLSPETPYPGAIEDVLGTLDWMTDHADELGMDRKRIAVSGESAGGTLAVNCCLLDTKKRIKLAAVVYGALDVLPAEQTAYHWDYSKYEMDESQKDYIMNRLYRFKKLSKYMEKLYVPEGFDPGDGNISPVYAKDVTNMPKTVMIEAEFDYYRLSNEVFVEKMIQEGKDVEVILYEGLDHGFFDRLGRLPQTADCIEEIARRVKEM